MLAMHVSADSLILPRTWGRRRTLIRFLSMMAYSKLRLTHLRSQCGFRDTHTQTYVHISTFVISFARQSSWQLRHTPPMIRVATIHAHLLIQAHLRRCQAVTHFKAAHSTLTIPSASHFNWMWVIHMTNVGCLPPCMCYMYECVVWVGKSDKICFRQYFSGGNVIISHTWIVNGQTVKAADMHNYWGNLFHLVNLRISNT